MVEKDIEKKIIDRIEGLHLEGLAVSGLWQPSATGIVKGTERSGAPAGLLVKVNPKGFATFGISEVSMDIALCLTVRIDMCPTGEELAAFCDPISRLLDHWNMVQCGEELEDFTVDGFDPGGIRVNQGTGPELDRQMKVWTVCYGLTLEGSITGYLNTNI